MRILQSMCLPPTLTYCFAVCNKAGMQEKQRELRTHLDAIARGNAGVPVSVNLHHTDLPLQLVRHALPRSSMQNSKSGECQIAQQKGI